MMIILFTIIALIFYYFGKRISKAEDPVNLWANDASKINVTDISAYNRACSRLIKTYALILFFLGLVINTKHTLAIILGYLMIVFASLGLIIGYTMIEGKWKK